MSGLSLRSLTFMLLIAFLVSSSNFESCSARSSRHWRENRVASASLQKKRGKNHSGSSSGQHHSGSAPKAKAPSNHKVKSPPLPKEDTPTSPPQKGQNGGHSVTFNVLDFGAKGNGNTDDTKAFQAAWAAACKIEASTLIIPAGSQFLVGPISFSGPYCAFYCIQFLYWLCQTDHVLPANMIVLFFFSQALRFYGSFNVIVTGITIQNSPQCHLKFDNCNGVLVHDMSVSSPGNSPNTDGIHTM